MGDLLGLFIGAAPSGLGLTGNDTEIVSMWDPSIFDGMQMHEDFAVTAVLRWDDLWSSVCVDQVLSIKTL